MGATLERDSFRNRLHVRHRMRKFVMSWKDYDEVIMV
jgi:hypothetical protein